MKKIKVLPGFEFTATFGFHVLGIFPEDKDLREMEHILLALNVPSDQLDQGSVTVGASADVLKAYEAISDAGGIAIATWQTSTPNRKGNGGTPLGTYRAEVADVQMGGYVWDQVPTSATFTIE